MRRTGEKALQLPAPRAEAWAWQMYATCRAYDVNDFYNTGQESRKALAAKKVCAGCPVLNPLP